MTLRKALLAATLLAAPAGAQAQMPSGLYIGIGVGLNRLADTDVTLTIPGSGQPRRGNAGFDWEPAFTASLGYAYGNGFRAEIEGSYRSNEVRRLTGFGNAVADTTSQGNVRSIGVMLNGYYDFNFGPEARIQPYLGAGIGYINHNYDDVRQTRVNGPVDVISIPGSEWTFGYQAILGAAFPVPEIGPGLSLTAEYRFMGTIPVDLEANRFGAAVVRRGDASTDNLNHTIFVGIRQMLGAPPVPPPATTAPSAAPAPARTYLVFFDFDRADLTDRARGIIAEAAGNAGRAAVTRIEVSGHADRAGTPQYNQRLSERRAAVVAAELERQGIPRSAISVQAFGESRPLVPTADGVREPQNRRVEIVLR